MGPEPRLDVADGQSRVKRGQGGGDRRGRIALHQDGGRLHGIEDGGEPLEHAGGDLAGRLRGAHHAEAVVRRHGEELEHLVEHLAVLVGDAHHRLQARRRGGEGTHHGRHLDGFGARAEHAEDARTIRHAMAHEVAHRRRSAATSKASRRSR